MQKSDLTPNELKVQKEIFAATIIHDLKNPLIAQIRSLELLKKEYWGKLNNEQKEILEVITESAVFMKEMLCSLLEVFKLESGFAILNTETFNINRLTELCINEYKPFALLKNIFISYKQTNRHEYISADKNIIRRVIINLLDNSIKYGFQNSTVYITLNETENNIVISFKNTGYKIANTKKEHIFEKFLSFSELSQQPGIGLGLYFCKKAIEAHNGNIKLISNGNINEFIIEIPKNIIK